MKLFLNSADPAEVKKYADLGIISGVTTNPTLLARARPPATEVVSALCSASPGPVSVQVVDGDLDMLLSTARRLAELSPKIAIKLPPTALGFSAATRLEREGVAVNVTLCFSLTQALWAANANVTYLSVFSGRLEAEKFPAEDTLREIVMLVQRMQGTKTLVIAASLNEPEQVATACRAGAHIATTTTRVLDLMLENNLTATGLEKFQKDWREAGRSL